MVIDFISIIISKEENLAFYKAIGFVEIDREYRPDNHDIIVWMKRNDLILKIFVDSTHPTRVSNPEAYGLRHISFKEVEIGKLHRVLSKYNPDPFKESNGKKFFFVKDPDGCPYRFEEA